MAVAPLLFLFHQRVILPRFQSRPLPRPPDDAVDPQGPVIIAGFGRFGNVVGRFLRSQGILPTVLENDPDHVALLRALGLRVFYGDACRTDLLEAAGAARARILILAIDDPAKSLALAGTVRRHFPGLRILARALSREHAYQLLAIGVTDFFQEQQGSALECAAEAAAALGIRRHAAFRAARAFRRHDDASVRDLAAHRHDRKAYVSAARARIEQFESLFVQGDRAAARDADAAWNVDDRRPPSSEPR